jgi:hypothetical protein
MPHWCSPKKALPPAEHHRATGKHATAGAPVAVTTCARLTSPWLGLAMLKWSWAMPTVPDPWAEACPALCEEFFDFLFFVIFQKSINFKNL